MKPSEFIEDVLGIKLMLYQRIMVDAMVKLPKYSTLRRQCNHADTGSNIQKLIKEYNWHERCDKNKGDRCEHCRCLYSVLSLGQTNGFFFGRNKH